MIKAVIFDMDGLLIDSEPVSYAIYQRIINQFHNSVFTLENYAQNYSGRTGEKNMQSLIEEFDLPMTIEEGFQFFVSDESKALKANMPLKPGAKELLEYLKSNQYQIALATTSSEERALDILKKNDILEYFSVFAYGSEVKNSKPHPDIFILAANKLRLDVSECLVLEDSEAGVQAAYNASIKVINIPDMKVPSEQYQSMIERTYPSLKDVIDYLEKQKYENT